MNTCLTNQTKTMTTDNEFVQKIASIEKQLYDLSDAVQKADNSKINWQYIAGKTESMKNTAKHVHGQVKHKAK